MEWTKQFFDGTWLKYGFELVTAEQTKGEVSFIEKELKLRRKESLLDLCCGIGRHSIPLAQKQYRVTGIDANPDYVRTAISNAITKKVDAKFIQGDVRNNPFVNKFEAAICVWSSFGYYSEDDDFRILKGVHKALKANGRFLIDVPNRDFIINHFRPRDWTKAGSGYVMEKRFFQVDSSRMQTSWIFAGDGRLTRKKSEMRLYALHELEALLLKARFKIVKRYGNFQGGRPGLVTPRLILVTRAA
jgi:SAM-dependent methyltransferase